MRPRPCRVRAVIERPEAPPWIVMPVPHTRPTEWWPGWLLSWRWIDREQGLWSGILRYAHDGRSLEHAVHGDLVEVDKVTEGVPRSVEAGEPAQYSAGRCREK